MKQDEQKPWTVDRTVGNLLEVRVNRLDSVEEVKRFFAAAIKAQKVTPDAVSVVDLRTPVVFAQPVASAVIEMMMKARPRRKTALLLSQEHAVFTMQLSRLVRQVGDPMRMTFTDPEDMTTWIADALTDSELSRVKVFVGRHKGLSTAS